MDAQFQAVVRGDAPADLLLTNARIVHVFTGEILPGDLAIHAGRIVGFGAREARETVDLEGRLLCPGFIDGHVHLESGMVHPSEFARTVVPRGTTTVIADPHEIANVRGAAGVRYMLTESEDLPLRVFFMAPSCVPATHMETAGGALEAGDIARLLRHPRVLGLGEVMNYPGVVGADPGVAAKLAAAAGRPVDGHAPGLGGRALEAYAAAGIGSDHECATRDEAWEKLRLGMHLLIREGSSARNLDALLAAVTPATAAQCSFCTDDRHPADLLRAGGIRDMVRRAIAAGIDPALAVRMASLNTARLFGLCGLGALAPGWQADLVVLDDFERCHATRVYHAGRLVACDEVLLATKAPPPSRRRPAPLRVRWPETGFRITAPATATTVARARVIELVPGQILTRSLEETVPVRDGEAVADPARDLLKLAVLERHHATGRMGLGFVRGFGLRRGALASSVAHDSHNLIVVGANDDDMAAAARAVIRMGGGQAVADGGRIVAELPLPIAGLMSDLPLEEVAARVEAMAAAARTLGAQAEEPMMTLAFLALPVIPELKLTDHGLVDVRIFSVVPLWLEPK